MATQSHALVLTLLHPFSFFPESSVCHKDSLSTISHIFTVSHKLSCSFLFPSSQPFFLLALPCPPLSSNLIPSLPTSFSLSLLPAHSLLVHAFSFLNNLSFAHHLFLTLLCYSHSLLPMPPLLLPCVCWVFLHIFQAHSPSHVLSPFFSHSLSCLSLTRALFCSLACACLCFFAHFLSQALALSHAGLFLHPCSTLCAFLRSSPALLPSTLPFLHPLFPVPPPAFSQVFSVM